MSIADTNQHPAVELACDLIKRQSVTPEDAGCQKIMSDRLRALGFSIETLPFGEVSNLWARHGETSPLLVFAGHTDVVPPGPVEEWSSDPFSPVIRDGFLYGRGAADMKGSLAAMITAVESFLEDQQDHNGSIGFLITSDEEGPSIDGTRRVVETLQAREETIDYCVVGEPSSTERIGDTIKNGRRGSLGAQLTVHGQQGHVAYPHLADNPIHRLAPALAELVAETWDEGDDHFPATRLQITNMHAGTGADNVIPGDIWLQFNLRFSPALTSENIQSRITGILDRHGLNYTLEWRLSGQPFLTAPGVLTEAMQSAVVDVTGLSAVLSTAGGTSDGRFIAPTGAEVAELGPVNATIHKIDECVSVSDLISLHDIYLGILRRILV